MNNLVALTVCPSSVSAASALTQLCDHPASQSIGLVRSESRRHLSALLNEPWDSSSGSGLVSRTSKAMCCILRTGSVWHQHAAARIIAAMGNASLSLRRVVCSVIAVHCSREVGECPVVYVMLRQADPIMRLQCS